MSFVTRTALGLVVLVLGVLLLLTGFDVLRWRGQLERGQVALAARSADPAVWEPETVLPTGVSRVALGAGEGVTYAKAVQQYELARRSRGPGFLQNPVLPTAQFTLLRFGQGDHPEVDRGAPPPRVVEEHVHEPVVGFGPAGTAKVRADHAVAVLGDPGCDLAPLPPVLRETVQQHDGFTVADGPDVCAQARRFDEEVIEARCIRQSRRPIRCLNSGNVVRLGCTHRDSFVRTFDTMFIVDPCEECVHDRYERTSTPSGG